MNLRLQDGRGRSCELPGRWIALEECRRDQVHASIGGLCGEDGRDQQLERIRMVQLGIRARMLRLELVQDVLRFECVFI